MAGNNLQPRERRQLGSHQIKSSPEIWPCYLERINNIQLQLKIMWEAEVTQGLSVIFPEIVMVVVLL